MIYNMGDGAVFPMYKSSAATVVAMSRVSAAVTVTIELTDGTGLTTNAPAAATQVRFAAMSFTLLPYVITYSRFHDAYAQGC